MARFASPSGVRATAARITFWTFPSGILLILDRTEVEVASRSGDFGGRDFSNYLSHRELCTKQLMIQFDIVPFTFRPIIFYKCLVRPREISLNPARQL
jgi:hypothetical protein